MDTFNDIPLPPSPTADDFSDVLQAPPPPPPSSTLASSTNDLECYLDRALGRMRSTQDKENDRMAGQPPSKQPRFKASEMKKLNAARTASKTKRIVLYSDDEAENVGNDSSEAEPARRKRQRKEINYNETRLRKEKEALAKENAATDFRALSRQARKNKTRKNDLYVVEAIEVLKYCRDRTCDYCLDYGRWMRLWYIKWEGYGPEHNTWEHAGNLENCAELFADAMFQAAECDPESEEQCMEHYNGPEVRGDDDGAAPLQVVEPDEVFPEPTRYAWMRFGGAEQPLPAAANPDDADDNRGTIHSGRTPDDLPFKCKDGTVLEPVIVTRKVWDDLKASFKRHGKMGTTVKEFMRRHQWAQRIQKSSGGNKGILRSKECDVSKQLKALGLFAADEAAEEEPAE